MPNDGKLARRKEAVDGVVVAAAVTVVGVVVIIIVEGVVVDDIVDIIIIVVVVDGAILDLERASTREVASGDDSASPSPL